jgi:hypothetical protein
MLPALTYTHSTMIFVPVQTIQLNQRVCMKKLLDSIKIPITITLIRQKINTEWTFGKDKSWSQKRSEKTKVIFFSRLKLTETTQYESNNNVKEKKNILEGKKISNLGTWLLSLFYNSLWIICYNQEIVSLLFSLTSSALDHLTTSAPYI